MVDDKLKFILDNVNNWLKFNETKNAALITMVVALIVCCINLLKESEKIIPYQYLVWYYLIVLLAVLLRSLWAIFAKLDNYVSYMAPPKEGKENILFYGHISYMTEEYFLNKIYEKYTSYKQPYYPTKFQRDLANQIIINSKISMRKANDFNSSAKILFWSITVAVIVFCFLA